MRFGVGVRFPIPGQLALFGKALARSRVGAAAVGMVTLSGKATARQAWKSGLGSVPVITTTSFTVGANLGFDAFIGHVDATNNPTTYAITGGNPSGFFALYPSGNLRTGLSATPPDNAYSLTVTASNTFGTSAAVTLNISVGAVPVVTDANFDVFLPATSGAAVGTVATTGGSVTSFAITTGNAAGYFAIDNSGAIRITATGAAGLTAQTFNLTVQATNSLGSSTGSITIDVTAASGDVPQFPNLLATYAVRPPSGTVPGVDFYVGCSSTITLKAPASATLPTGVTRSGTTFTVSGNNVTLDGWDFSLGNGWAVVVNGDNCIIQNCNFQIGSNNNLPITIGTGADGTKILSCTLDGGGPTSTPHSVVQVNSTTAGTVLDMENCFIRNLPEDGIQIVSAVGAFIFKNNLYTNGVSRTGAHADLVQYSGGNVGPVTYQYNLQVVTWFDANVASQVHDIEAQVVPAAIHDLDYSNNVAVCVGGVPNDDPAASTIFYINQDTSCTIGPLSIHDNYADAESTYFFWQLGTFSPGPLVTWNNIDMVSGQTVRTVNTSSGSSRPANAPAPPTITTATPSGSTVTLVGTGPVSTKIHIFIDGGNIPDAEVTSNGTGAWSYTTGTLANGDHTFVTRSTSSFNSSTPSSVKTVTVTGSGDAPQMPNLFAGYSIRPPAGTVPGVDFYVGCPSTAVLKNIATATLPSGVTRNTSTRTIQVANANTVLDGWDFSVNGGYSIIVNATGVTITNSKFVGGNTTGEPQIRFGQGSGSANNGIVTFCTLDNTGMGGRNLPGVISQDSRYSGMRVENCYIKNGDSDGLAMGGGQVTFKNNFIENLGTGAPAGAHPDIVQINSSTTTANTFDIQNNCAYSSATATTLNGIQGYMLDTNGGPSITGGVVSGNVIIGPANSYFLGNGSASGTVTYSNNYLHPTTGDVGWARPGSASSHVIFSNNFNLRTGVLQPTNP